MRLRGRRPVRDSRNESPQIPQSYRRRSITSQLVVVAPNTRTQHLRRSAAVLKYRPTSANTARSVRDELRPRNAHRACSRISPAASSRTSSRYAATDAALFSHHGMRVRAKGSVARRREHDGAMARGGIDPSLRRKQGDRTMSRTGCNLVVGGECLFAWKGGSRTQDAALDCAA